MLFKVFSTFWVLVVQQCQSEVVPPQPCSRQTSNTGLSQVSPRLTSIALTPLPSHTSSPTAEGPGCALGGDTQALPRLVAFTDILGPGCVITSSIVCVPAQVAPCLETGLVCPCGRCIPWEFISAVIKQDAIHVTVSHINIKLNSGHLVLCFKKQGFQQFLLLCSTAVPVFQSSPPHAYFSMIPARENRKGKTASMTK